MESLEQRLWRAKNTPNAEEVQAIIFELASRSEEGEKLVAEYNKIQLEWVDVNTQSENITTALSELQVTSYLRAMEAAYRDVREYKNKLFEEKCKELKVETASTLEERIARIREGLNALEMERVKMDLMQNDEKGMALLATYEEKKAEYESSKQVENELKRSQEKAHVLLFNCSRESRQRHLKIVAIGKKLLKQELEKT